MVDRFEETRPELFHLFLHDFVGTAGGIGFGGFLGDGDFLVGPVEAGDVGAEVEAQRGVVAEESGEGDRVGRIEQDAVLGRGGSVGHQFEDRGGKLLREAGEQVFGGKGRHRNGQS